MENKIINSLIVIILIFICQISLAQENNSKTPNKHIWTFTYIKATESQKTHLKSFLEKNWFYLDSIAIAQGVFNAYELLENTDANTTEWDFIVAVEYFTEGGYTDEVAEKFQKIRKEHGKMVLINGLGFKELGKIVKSENVKRHQYLLKQN